MLRIYLMICFFLLNGVFCLLQTAPLHSPLAVTGFLLNLAAITGGLYQSVRNPRLNLDTIIWVFVYLFFFLAPVVQIMSGPFFPNSVPIRATDVIRANAAILLWNIVYLALRYRRDAGHTTKAETGTNTDEQTPSGLEFVGKWVRGIYFVLSLLVFLATVALFKQGFFFGYADYGAVIGEKSLLLIANITIQGMVFANWLFAFDLKRRMRRHVGVTAYLLVSTVILLHQLSPFNTNRSYLGFCIILIVYLFYPHKVKPSQFVWVIFTGLLVIFPFLNYFRYGFKGIEIPPLKNLMFDQLTELHFDAYSNLIATFEYVEALGFAWGYQMLGVFFFFVPRGIWTGKPLNSGEAVGDFIATRYAMDFSNISNPIPSEFYLNFGWAGIVLGAAVIAGIVNKLEGGGKRNLYAHGLIAGYLFVIFRGDLMNAFAYCFGTYVVMVLMPSMLTAGLRKPAWTAPAGRLTDG